MKIRSLPYSLVITILFSSACLADSKTITLKDGSSIKGELVSFQNGTYVIQTENLGQLKISESNVLGVNSGAVQPAVANSNSFNPSTPMGMSPALTQQVSSMQNQIMANPQMFKIIEQMAQDPEFVQMVSDPNFMQELMNAVNTNDTKSLENNPKIQKILSNPNMQNLLQQMGPPTY